MEAFATMTLKEPFMTTPSADHNAINWFEIPCADLDRAQAFYEQLLGRPIQREDFGGAPMALFASAPSATGGCLVMGPAYRTAPDAGLRIYLDCEPGVEAALARAKAAGGQVLEACTELPKALGFVAQICDTEGNTIGLHATAR
jgi:predicted enzyme related to lactoylglutathione lyase